VQAKKAAKTGDPKRKRSREKNIEFLLDNSPKRYLFEDISRYSYHSSSEFDQAMRQPAMTK
jgi:hypothetical protein